MVEKRQFALGDTVVDNVGAGMYAAKQTKNKKYIATVGQPCLAFGL